MTCTKCDNMDYWYSRNNTCMNCPASDFYQFGDAVYCKPCNGGDPTTNDTDYFDRTTNRCVACPAWEGNYSLEAGC